MNEDTMLNQLLNKKKVDRSSTQTTQMNGKSRI